MLKKELERKSELRQTIYDKNSNSLLKEESQNKQLQAEYVIALNQRNVNPL